MILDAGKGYIKPMRPGARPGGNRPASACHIAVDENNPCFAKHVVLRTDRSDGFVGRNFLMRGAREHGFYTEETDGILLDRVKFFWNADYGHLSFTTDHNVIQNCDGFGSGDAVVYPGASPQTGLYRDEDFYPQRRYNTVVRRCDLHGSSMGYSGSMGNSVLVKNNRFYGNANGLTTDTISSPGHPGFPADGMKIDRQLALRQQPRRLPHEDNPFEALVPQPVGTGFWWAGNNDGDFVNNWVFDNFRQGTFLISIPDAVTGEAEGAIDDPIHCPNTPGPFGLASTSCYNTYRGNRMGEVPPNFRPHPALRKFGNQTTLLSSPARARERPRLRLGRAAGQPRQLLARQHRARRHARQHQFGSADRADRRHEHADVPAGACAPRRRPIPALPANHDPATSMGNGPAYTAKAPILLTCYGEWETGNLESTGCTWWNTPPRPRHRSLARPAAGRAARRRALGCERPGPAPGGVGP